MVVVAFDGRWNRGFICPPYDFKSRTRLNETNFKDSGNGMEIFKGILRRCFVSISFILACVVTIIDERERDVQSR